MFLKAATVIFFQDSPKSHQSFLATFKSKFDVKNFQRSPNQVTLMKAKIIQMPNFDEFRSSRFLWKIIFEFALIWGLSRGEIIPDFR